MPDPQKETVSASQTAALLGCSPWQTRHMLYQWFIGELDEDIQNDAMTWGKRLEKPILEAAGDELRLDIMGNQDYYTAKNLPIGATADGYAITRDTGELVWVEAKNVSEWAYRDNWDNANAPLHIEVQVQTQLAVPHPDHGWPVCAYIAALVGGNDLKILRREPDPLAQTTIGQAAYDFLERVAKRRPPELTGVAMELPSLLRQFPASEKEPVEYMVQEVNQLLADYQYWQRMKRDGEKFIDDAKPKILELAEDASGIISIDLKAGIKRWLVVRQPGVTEALQDAIENVVYAGDSPRRAADEELIAAWFDWQKKERTFSRAIKINISDKPKSEAEADEALNPLEAG